MAARINSKTKAAVIAALLSGEAIATVATRYNIDKSTVSRWKSGLTQSELQQVATAKKQSISDILENGFTTFLAADLKLAEDYQDDDWRRSLSVKDRLSLSNYFAIRSREVVELAGKMFGPAQPPEPEPILELPAVDFASDLDVQAETPAIDSDGAG